MADGRHFRTRFLAITQQLSAQFQLNFAWGSSFSQNFSTVTYFLYFPNAVWALTSGSFRIISDTLVIYIIQLQRCILVKLERVQCVVKNLS